MIRFPGLKRCGDVLLATTGLIVLSPLIVAVGLAVRLVLGQPVLFDDLRAGRDARPIRIRKFRSMRIATDSEGRSLPDAQRLTLFGRLLRQSSLDELPQLASVLVGDMSVVGPRPLPLEYVGRYSSREATRLLVRPGLTGWAQIHGRNAVAWPKRLEYDAQYVEMLGRWYWPILDAWIIAVTAVQIVWQGITGRGVSAPGAATMEEFRP